MCQCVIANVVGADFDNITPTPILAAFSKISDDMRPLKNKYFISNRNLMSKTKTVKFI